MINDDAPEEAKRSYVIYCQQIQEELKLRKKLRTYRIRILKEFSKDYPWTVTDGIIYFILPNGYQMSIDSMERSGEMTIYLSMDWDNNGAEEMNDYPIRDYKSPYEIYLAMREWLKNIERNHILNDQMI